MGETKQDRIGRQAKRKCLQNAEKQLFDQPVVSELLQLWNFITHLFFCQSDEEVIKMKQFIFYSFVRKQTRTIL